MTLTLKLIEFIQLIICFHICFSTNGKNAQVKIIFFISYYLINMFGFGVTGKVTQILVFINIHRGERIKQLEYCLKENLGPLCKHHHGDRKSFFSL